MLFCLFLAGQLMAQNINRLEYFIDGDPGPGNGTEVNITPGTVVTQTFPVSLSSLTLADGIHRFSIRARDDNNQWSWVANQLFVKERITNTAAPIDITKVEYFFNQDPGAGNGIDVPITQGTLLTNLGFTVPIPSLPVGFHYLSVRVKDARNGWTRCITRPFLKEEIASNIPLPNITQIEYFIDEDPGVGNGSPLTFTQGTTVNSLSFTMSLPTNLSKGFHTFSVRAKNANGKWSLVSRRTFINEKIQSAIPLPAISRVEYFFDNDPGYGNGTNVNFSAGTTVNNLTFDAVLPGSLSDGLHNLTARVKDNNGKWSTALIKSFFKENLSTLGTTPNITKLEYFIDTDPGFGSATNIAITPGTSLANVTFSAPVNSLINGKHVLEIRAKNANNQWSTVAIREFVVCNNPFTSAISPSATQSSCAGSPINLSVPNTPGVSYQWRVNGNDIYGSNTYIHPANSTGDYTVVVAQNGCLFTTNPVRVEVTSLPSPPTITTANQTICNGQSVTINSTNCAGTVTWSNGQTGAVLNVTPTSTTTYTAICSLNGCTSGTSTTSTIVTVNSALGVPVISGPTAAVCPLSNTTLTASGCIGTLVNWSTGQTGTSISFVATKTETYTAFCKSATCSGVNSSPFTLSVSNASAHLTSLSASKLKICNGQSSTLTATGCSGSLLWSTGATTAVITVAPSANTTYSATCTQGGCTSPAVNTLLVIVDPLPSAPTIYGQSQTICKGTSIGLSAYYCVGGTINWSNGYVGQFQTVSPIVTTTYTATCTQDGCPSGNSNAIVLTVSECQDPAVNITKIEYFVDNDPGFDNGTDVPITSASFLNDFNFSVPIQASLVSGYHLLSVRAKDANGRWAWTVVRPFFKDELPFVTPLANIVKLEYFIDNDPGYEVGTDIPITAGTNISNLGISIPLDNSLVTGWHNLTIRAKDANGNWSEVAVKPFYKDDLPGTTTLPNITKLEYYIDLDPGYDAGIDIPITAATQLNNIPLTISMDGLLFGSHFLAIRAKNADGVWSTVGIKPFVYGSERVVIGGISTDFCSPTSLSMPYLLEGVFNAGNTVKVQLLDANGNLVNSNLVTQTSIASGTITVPLPNVSSNTIYKLRIVTSDPVLNSDPVQITLKPSTIPSILVSGPTTFCFGGSVLLSVNNCAGNVTWSNGISNNMISVTSSGNYAATCTLENGCAMPSSNSIAVTVTGGEANSPTVTGNLNLCGTGNTTVLTAAGCSGGSYRWYLVPTGGSQQSTANPYTTPQLGSNTTFYSACVISGCESTRTPVTVTVTPTPQPPLIASPSPTSICATQSSTLTATNCTGTVTWSNGMTGNSIIVSPVVTTNYSAVCTVNGCVSNASTLVTVTITSNCNYVISITPSRVFVCPNTPLTLTATGCPNTITWTGGATGSSVTIIPAVTGTYTANCAAGGSGNIVVTIGATTAALTNTDNIQTGMAKFQVTQVLTSSSLIGNSAINPKPNVLYQAGNSITLQPGFFTEPGVVFNAKIQGCN